MISVVALAVLLWAATNWLIARALIQKAPSYLLEVLLFLSTSTVIVFYFLQKTKTTEPLDFVKNFLLSVILKILLGALFIFILMRLDSASAYANALFFMISYLLFTGYEVAVLMKRKNLE
jgi:hypothetical protein